MEYDLLKKLYTESFSTIHPSSFVDKKAMDLAKLLNVTVMSPMAAAQIVGLAVPHHALACYEPEFDVVTIKNVKSEAGDPSVAMLHELIHATGHPKRLGRPALMNRYRSDEESCTEEATAQMGMHALAQYIGISADLSAGYLEYYLGRLPYADLKKAQVDAGAAFAYIMQKIQSGSPRLKRSRSASS